MSVDDARMHRAFVYLAPVRICDRGAQHDRSDGRKGEGHDDEQRQEVPKPWKSIMWLAVQRDPNDRLRVNTAAHRFEALTY